MKILVNFSESERSFLPVLQYYLRSNGFTSCATTKTHTPSTLVDLAKQASCQGIFLCNQETLANCVPGQRPTLDLYRGSRLDFSVPVIVGNSLLQIHTVDHGKFVLETDLKKLLKLSVKVGREFQFTVLSETSLFSTALAVLSKAIFIAYDIETVTVFPTGEIIEGEIPEGSDEEETDDHKEGGDTIITCASYTAFLPSGEFQTFVLPFYNFLECHWPDSHSFSEAISFLRTANALPIPKAMHNGMYDCFHSIIYRAFPRDFAIDTMAMMHAQYPSLPKSLDYVASIVLPDYYQWKPQAKSASRSRNIQEYWGYNAKDTFNTARIALHYLRYLPTYARRNYAKQFKLVYPSLYCGFEGFRVDNNKRKELLSIREKAVASELLELQTMLADKGDIHAKKPTGFNPGSSKQVAFYIYDILGAADPRIGFRKANGRKTRIVRGTDKKNLEAVGRQHPLLRKVTSKILSYKGNSKAISTYFNFAQKNGRLLYSINPFGTETGRFSCSKSALWCGTQIQNIPPYAKGMLVADDDFILCEPDNSQSEARCTAYLFQETALITALETPGRDFYKTLGTLFFSIPYEEVTTEFRNLVLKKIVHGTNYMMGAETFIQNAGEENLLFAASVLGIKITPHPVGPDQMTMKAFAASLLEKYHGPFPRIRKGYSEVKNEISTTNTLTSPLGHTRYFFGDIHKKYQIFASAVAHGPQNLSVDILNIGWWKLWLLQKEEPLDLRMKAQVHDSSPFQYRKGREDLRAKAIQCFRNPVTVHGRVLRIPVDYKYGPNWAEMTKGKE